MKIDQKTIKAQLKKCQKALDDMENYQVQGALAHKSGELYGMRNALAWAAGEDVASPSQILKQMEKEQP